MAARDMDRDMEDELNELLGLKTEEEEDVAGGGGGGGGRSKAKAKGGKGRDLVWGMEEEQAVVHKLQAQLFTEKAAPEILKFKEDLVEDIQSQIAQQEKTLSSSAAVLDSFTHALYQMDIERAKYALASYLRVRLAKIQRYAFHIISNSEESEKLSSAENAFLTSYVNLLGTHFETAALRQIHNPKISTLVEDENIVRSPPLSRHVVCRVTSDVGEFALDDAPDSTVELREGGALMVRYSSIRSLVMSGSVQLT